MNKEERLNFLQKHQESLIPTIKDKQGYIRPTSLQEAVERNNKTIISVKKNAGFKPLVGWVKGRLIELLTYLGMFDVATEYQVQMLALRICNKFYYFTVSELDYFFIAFSNGEYGRLLSRRTLNPQDIVQALILYEKDVLNARAIAVEKRRKEMEREKERKESLKPHGREAWEIYCKSEGLDPNTHKIKGVSFVKDMNKELSNNKNNKS